MNAQLNDEWDIHFKVKTLGSYIWVSMVKNMTNGFDYIQMSAFLEKVKCCVYSFSLKYTPEFRVLEYWIYTIGNEIKIKRDQKFNSIFPSEELGWDVTDLR